MAGEVASRGGERQGGRVRDEGMPQCQQSNPQRDGLDSTVMHENAWPIRACRPFHIGIQTHGFRHKFVRTFPALPSHPHGQPHTCAWMAIASAALLASVASSSLRVWPMSAAPLIASAAAAEASRRQGECVWVVAVREWEVAVWTKAPCLPHMPEEQPQQELWRWQHHAA